MPAMVRRHWGVVVAMVLVGLSAAGWLLFSRSSLAQESAAQPRDVAVAAPRLDPNTAARVQRLRERLMLDNADIAAMGCGQAAAENVLRALGSWCESNRLALEQVELDFARARNELTEAMRRVNVGPKDESVIRQVPVLQQSLAATVQRQRALEQMVVPVVAAQLNPSQNTMWSHGRANGRVPERYRFAPGLQRDQLSRLANRDSVDTHLAGQEASVLSAEQKLAVEAAAVNRQNNMAGVCAAEQSVLPQPEPMMAVELLAEPVTGQ